LETATNLASLSLEGYANFGSNDEVNFCVSGVGCSSISITDQVLNLYLNWQDSEFNVFGYGDGSQANFNQGTTITVTNTLKDQSGNVIVPSCASGGYTGETNNLNLGSCSQNIISGQIVFTESSPSVPLSTISGFTSDATGQILFVVGDLNVGGFTHGSKPPGVGFQVGRDTTPLGFISGMLTNSQPTVFDDNTGYVASNGRPTTSISLIFVFGNGVNAVENYYETTSNTLEQTPITLSQVGSNWVWTDRGGAQVASVSTSSVAIPPGNSDVFVIEILQDASGRIIVILYGLTYLGTWAAAWYFKYKIYPNISSDTQSYYVVRWTDQSSGPYADYTPDTGDTYTILAQG
jgi:hypothetical protein